MYTPKITDQTRLWSGKFGRDYVTRNDLPPDQLDEKFGQRFGITRRSLFGKFIGDLNPAAMILEIGCCTGQQLSLLASDGFSNSCGLELQFDACVQAKSNGNAPRVVCGDSLSLPFASQSFELVYTFFLLSHIPDADLRQVMTEITRCSSAFVFGVEAYAPVVESIPYRGEESALWNRDNVKKYLEIDGVDLIDQRLLYSADGKDFDQAFLLKISR